jgi:hypothetical protein
MAEPGSIESKTGTFALARTTFLQTLEADDQFQQEEGAGAPELHCRLLEAGIPYPVVYLFKISVVS